MVVEWLESNSGTDGVRTMNAGVHVMNLVWGKVTRLLICQDTTGLVATLDRLFASGSAEAHANTDHRLTSCGASTVQP